MIYSYLIAKQVIRSVTGSYEIILKRPVYAEECMHPCIVQQMGHCKGGTS